MSSISAWILSIAGICLLSVAMDLILPEGKMNAVIKNVFSYIVVFVVLMPLPSLINGEFSFGDLFSSVELEIQDEYIYNVNQAKLDKWSKDIDNDLQNIGVYGAVVSISANIFEYNMKIDAVYVDLYNAVISENLMNKNIKAEVENVVLSIVDLDKNKVVIYE